MNRNYVPAAVVTTLVVALAGGVFAIGIAPTTASASSLATTADATLEGSSASGQVEDITLSISGDVSWESLDSDPAEIRIRVVVTDGPGSHELASETFTDVPAESSGSHSFDGVGGSVIDDTGYSAADFSAEEDGGTNEQTFTAAVEAEIVTEDGESILTADSNTIDVVISNEEEQNQSDQQSAASAVQAEVTGDVQMNETGG